MEEASAKIREGRTALGIELGSTRIKAVLVDSSCKVLATGSFLWENQLKDGIWTYSLKDVWKGIQACYADLCKNVEGQYHEKIKKLGALGISGMMHGYLVFDSAGNQLSFFKTWRNTTTEKAADALTEAFSFHIPQRWSIAHLYQAILDGEPHVGSIAYMTTLSGYIHCCLSGEKVLGASDASGMFPLAQNGTTFHSEYLQKFRTMDKVSGFAWDIADILPQVLLAGSPAGHLTKRGAALLDPTGDLQPGCLMAPPEGDAGTGMVSTNSIRRNTGNISIGTSAFSMNVLDSPLKRMRKEIDLVMTPHGLPVAMVHTNNCASDIDAWVRLFVEFGKRAGLEMTMDEYYRLLLEASSEGRADAGGLLHFSCVSGEHNLNLKRGRPFFLRDSVNEFSLPNFMKSLLYAAFAPLRIGMDVLVEDGVHMNRMVAQGGLLRTPVIVQQVMANILDTPIAVMETSSEGGPWGMAVLAQYAKEHSADMTLEQYLDAYIFPEEAFSVCYPKQEESKGANDYMERYKQGLFVEKSAISH